MKIVKTILWIALLSGLSVSYASAALIKVELSFSGVGFSGVGVLEVEESVLAANTTTGSNISVSPAFTSFTLTFTGPALSDPLSPFATVSGSSIFTLDNLGGLRLSTDASGDLASIEFFAFGATTPLNSDDYYLASGSAGLEICVDGSGPTNFGCGINLSVGFTAAPSIVVIPNIPPNNGGPTSASEPATIGVLLMGLVALIGRRFMKTNKSELVAG